MKKDIPLQKKGTFKSIDVLDLARERKSFSVKAQEKDMPAKLPEHITGNLEGDVQYTDEELSKGYQEHMERTRAEDVRHALANKHMWNKPDAWKVTPNTCEATARSAFRDKADRPEKPDGFFLESEELIESYRDFLKDDSKKVMIVSISTDIDTPHIFTLEKRDDGRIRIHNSWVFKYHKKEWDAQRHDRRNMVDGVEGDETTSKAKENMQDSFAIRSAMKNFGGEAGISQDKANQFMHIFSKILDAKKEDGKADMEKVNEYMVICFGVPLRADNGKVHGSIACDVDIG